MDSENQSGTRIESSKRRAQIQTGDLRERPTKGEKKRKTEITERQGEKERLPQEEPKANYMIEGGRNILSMANISRGAKGVGVMEEGKGKGYSRCVLEAEGPTHSESLPESLESLESLDLSPSPPFAPPTPGVSPPFVVAVPFSNKAILASRALIFSASTSSSILFRFSPPVPVPLPVRARFG
jgi:hypothetical protein